MAITPLNQGGTGADLSGTGGANEFVKQTAAGANFSVAALTTADVAGVGIVKNPTAAQTISGQPLTLSNTSPLMLAAMEHIQFVDETLFRGGSDIGDEINRAYAMLNTSLATTGASRSGSTATLTMASNPTTFGFASGQTVFVSGFTGTDIVFNGTVVLLTVSSTTITYMTVTSGTVTATSNGTVSFASGGTICIAPKANGALYKFQTAIVFGVQGKYVRLVGLSPASQNGTPEAGTMGGSSLLFTPTTSGTNLSLSQVLTSLTLSAVATSSGGSAVYTGTIPSPTNALVGLTFAVAGFVTHTSNNGTFVCTANTATTITLSNAGAVAETHAATATLPSGNAIYLGTITGGASNAFAGKTFQIYGFLTNMVNNGWYVCTASTTTTLILHNSFAVAETPVSAATASQTITAITYANDGGSNGDAFVPGNVIENLTIANSAQFIDGGNYGTSSGSAAVGIDFTKAGRLCTYNVKIAGFGVGRQCIQSVNWGAQDNDLTISHCGVSSIWHECQEKYKWVGGTCVDNGRGEQFSAELGTPFDGSYIGVSFDSNGSVFGGVPGTPGTTTATGYGLAFCGMAGNLSYCAPSFTDCHFENLISGTPWVGAVPPTYVYVGNGPITINGGLASNDNDTAQPAGYTAPYWFSANGTYAGAGLTVNGLVIVGNSQPNTCIFQANGGGGVVSGSFGPPAPSIGGQLITGTAAQNVVNFYTYGVVQLPNIRGTATVPYNNSSAVKVGATVTGGAQVILRDSTNGGTAVVILDTTGSPTVVNQTGNTVFAVTGSPTANQLGLAFSGLQLTVIGGSSRTSGTLQYIYTLLE